MTTKYCGEQLGIVSYAIQFLLIVSTKVLSEITTKDTPCEPGELFPHETNYANFYMCNKGKRVPVSCPYGLYFNQNAEGCDYVSEDFLLKVQPLPKYLPPPPPVRTSTIQYTTTTPRYSMNSFNKFKVKTKSILFKPKPKPKLRNFTTSLPFRLEPDHQPYVMRKPISKPRLETMYADVNIPSLNERQNRPKIRPKLRTTPEMESEMMEYLEIIPDTNQDVLVSGLEMYPDLISRETTKSLSAGKKTKSRPLKKKRKQKDSMKKQKAKMLKRPKTKTMTPKGLDLHIYPDYEMYLNVEMTKKPKTVPRAKTAAYINIKQRAKLAMEKKITPETEFQQYLDVYPEFKDNGSKNTKKSKTKYKKHTTPSYILKISVPTPAPQSEYNSHITDSLLKTFPDLSSVEEQKEIGLYTDNGIDPSKETDSMEVGLENYQDQMFEV